MLISVIGVETAGMLLLPSVVLPFGISRSGKMPFPQEMHP